MEFEKRRHYLYALKNFGDERGGLVVLNSNIEIPFVIERVFYNYHTRNDIVRGNHANKHSAFVMVSLKGACIVDVDDGKNVTKYILDSPEKALFIDKGLWKVMRDFSEDNVLLVFSDCQYDESEYIRDYDQYLNLTKIE